MKIMLLSRCSWWCRLRRWWCGWWCRWCIDDVIEDVVDDVDDPDNC